MRRIKMEAEATQKLFRASAVGIGLDRKAV